jgi:hypothetical protein
MMGSAPYVAAAARFDVPTLIPGPTAAAALWPGVGGFLTSSGLIQAGVSLETRTMFAVYGTWREYCCGNPDSNGYGGNFTPHPGDRIQVYAWYCDDKGEENLNGGYGCSHVHDLTSGLFFSCTLPRGTDGSGPCWSVKAMPDTILGTSAEFILESPQLMPPRELFPKFTPFSIVGLALRSAGSITWVDIDPNVILLTDYTRGPPHVEVTLPGNLNTSFRARYPLSGRKQRHP